MAEQDRQDIKDAAERLARAKTAYWRAHAELSAAQRDHDRVLHKWFDKHYASRDCAIAEAPPPSVTYPPRMLPTPDEANSVEVIVVDPATGSEQVIYRREGDDGDVE